MPSIRLFSLLSLGCVTAMGTCGHAFAAPLSNATLPSISPDGKRIVFVRRTPQGNRLYVANLDGTAARLVGRPATLTGGNDTDPCWRGDGKSIVFASNRGGNYDLFTVSPDGSALKQISKTPFDEREPQWSPRPYTETTDGGNAFVERSKSIFTKSDLQLLQQLAGGKAFEKYEANSEGKYPFKARVKFYRILCAAGKSGQEKLATLREDGSWRFDLPSGMTGGLLHPRWERSGTKIAFTRRIGAAQEALYVANVPIPEEIYGDDVKPTDVVAQPRVINGEKAKYGVYLRGWRQSFARRTTVAPGSALSWTPNGEFIAVASDRMLRLVRADDRYGTAESGERAKLVGAATSGTVAFGGDARTAYVSVRTGATPSLVTVRLREPLLDVVNWLDFAGWYDSGDFGKADRAALARNSFTAAGMGSKQMYSIYEGADYSNLPVFVSSDSLLHLNHLVFDYILRNVETEHLMPAVIQLANHHLGAALRQYRAAPSPELKAAALSNATYWSIAARLALGETLAAEAANALPAATASEDSLEAQHQAAVAKANQARLARLKVWTTPLLVTLKEVPPQAKAVADKELVLIREHKERAISPLFGGALTGVDNPNSKITDTRIDYTDFQPRGHYTRTEILKRYFLATRWLADAPIRPNETGAQQALLMLSAEDATSTALRRKITRVISEFVGDADDLTLDQYENIAHGVWGTAPLSLAALQNKAKLGTFVTKIQALPGPRIAGSMGAALRFLPQPYTFDAEISQNLIYDTLPPDVGTRTQPRYFALGLDVMGVLGSNRARQILDNTQFQSTFFDFNLKETQYAHYDTQFKAERTKVAAMPASQWESNIYSRTMWALKPLLTPKPDKRYRFTQTQAWTDKQLNTSLATWAELKHDTMPKQPVAIEAGDGAMLTEAIINEQPVGFVEPSREVYLRLRELVKAERVALQRVGYLSPELSQRLNTFEALLGAILHIEAKQNVGQALTPVEVEQLRFYGTFLEHLTLASLDGQVDSLEDTDMAIIADVAAAFSTRLNKQLVLQEGVGHALPIYVAVERNGTRTLTQGAIFTYYEFTYPAADRLTDAKWQKYLASPDRPKMPSWTQSFISSHREVSSQ